MACSNQKIDGTWVLSYTDSESSFPIFSEIITFDNGFYESDNFSFGPLHYEKSNGTYKLENQKLIFNDTTKLSVLAITNDSLITRHENISYILKKLNDTLKNKEPNKIKLEGLTFDADYGGPQISTITFQSGRVLFDSQLVMGSSNKFMRTNHNGFDILFQEFALPRIIKGIDRDTIMLYAFHKKVIKIKMWKK